MLMRVEGLPVQLTLTFVNEARLDTCALCGGRLRVAAGPCLALEGHDAVCRPCGMTQSPRLVALLDLAQAAQRVGQVSRHVLVPPMGLLLELARAAEEYAGALPRPAARAA